uniref:BPTI/Kunitz inhibitor domain-containing protein n=1 Tax=Mesocestoides corti TaxID=53468 RepID=A0A5K3FHF3_MESCO
MFVAIFLLTVCAASALETYVNPCTLPIEQGPCQNFLLMWGFDAAQKRCIRFVYGGCLGNSNRFYFKWGCEYACMRS